MPNLTAINSVAQKVAPVAAALAPAKGAVATTSEAVGIASAATKAASTAAGASGAIGSVLGAAVPILGIAAVAAPVVGNLISCGTVSQVGCQKRSDSTNLINARLAVVNTAYQVQSGALTPAQGIQALKSLAASAPAAFQNPGSWMNPTTYYQVCGSFSNNGTQESGPPCGTPAVDVVATGTSVSGPQFVQDYINWMQSLPGAASSSISAGLDQTVAAVTGGTGANIPLLIALSVGLFIFIKAK